MNIYNTLNSLNLFDDHTFVFVQSPSKIIHQMSKIIYSEQIHEKIQLI